MALEYNIISHNGKETMALGDETGDFDGILNPGGWGAPNPVRGDVSDCDVVITTPGGVDLDSIDLGTFLNSTTSYDLTSDLEAQDTSLDDGIWKFVFTITGVSPTTYTFYGLRTNTLQARVQSLALNNLDVIDFREAETLFRKIGYAFEAGEYVLAEELIEDLNTLLEDCNTTLGNCGC